MQAGSFRWKSLSDFDGYRESVLVRLIFCWLTAGLWMLQYMFT